MIKCKAVMQIHGSSSAACSDDIWLCLAFEMPFAPTMGMTLNISEEIELELIDRPRYQGGCCQMVFDVPSQELRIYFEHMPEHGGPRDREKSIKQTKLVAKDYMKLGWKKYRD